MGGRSMGDQLNALTTIFTEFYYWVTIVMMFLIHVGFCTYEVGVSRRRNHLKTLMKNAMAIPLVTVTFFFFGWWIYFAFINGPGITGGLVAAPYAEPWNPLMAAHLSGVNANEANSVTAAEAALWHRLNGVFFGAFLLFSITTASIVSGAIIERARSGAFWIVAVLVGSVLWILDASWGWHPLGWMVRLWGYHDAYASGVVHAIAGGAALAFLIVLGPRIGKFRADGTPRDIPPHNVWLVCDRPVPDLHGLLGLLCRVQHPAHLARDDCRPDHRRNLDGDDDLSDANHTFGDHLQLPDVAVRRHDGWLSRFQGRSVLDVLLRLMRHHWRLGRERSLPSDPGHADRRDRPDASAYKLHYFVENRFKIDDAVGAVAVHGYGGFIGVVIAGFMLWGTPSSPYEGFAQVNPLGNFAGACLMFLLGFIPIYIVCKILDSFGLLRVPAKVELEGVDFAINRAFLASVREVGDAEKAMIK